MISFIKNLKQQQQQKQQQQNATRFKSRVCVKSCKYHEQWTIVDLHKNYWLQNHVVELIVVLLNKFQRRNKRKYFKLFSIYLQQRNQSTVIIYLSPFL